ncbi:hypothetical protein [Thermoflavimicrobium daqui]|jgi:hypothetical protein|uniref:hypothetical protein n=1 Tax=Thermoflavimicrobium daqui TaxID=2137476 RepID=UPI00143D0F6F|nr:hypothetical protein [Thermoflavimicrobium daqui]
MKRFLVMLTSIILLIGMQFPSSVQAKPSDYSEFNQKFKQGTEIPGVDGYWVP